MGKDQLFEKLRERKQREIERAIIRARIKKAYYNAISHAEKTPWIAMFILSLIILIVAWAMKLTR